MNEKLPKLSKEQLSEVGRELLPTEVLRESLDLTERGTPKPTISNVVRILKEDPFFVGSIRLNELTERIDITRDLGWRREGDILNDTDMAYITLYIEENYCISNSNVIEKAIQIIANENRYHPIRDILNDLVWDGTSRLANMLAHFFGVEKKELTTESIKLFMLGAVCRVFDPGCKFETSICLVGDQGAGKSTLFRFLAIKDEYFSDDLKRLDDEKIVVKLQGHWIVEMPEMLATLNSRRVEEIKSFLSRQKDTYRTPYEKHPKDRRRQCVFGGTSNKMEVLPMDKSGNRRIIPIETHIEKAEIHILDNEDESREYILQVWAEIMEIYRSGRFSLTLPRHLQAELAKYQERFTPEDNDQESIEYFLTNTQEKYVCVKMLAYEALGYSQYDQLKKSDCNRISEMMHHFPEWEAVGTRTVSKYGRVRAWRRKADTSSDDGFVKVSEQMEIPFK